MDDSQRTRCAAMSPEASVMANRDDALADASGYIRAMNTAGKRPVRLELENRTLVVGQF